MPELFHYDGFGSVTHEGSETIIYNSGKHFGKHSFGLSLVSEWWYSQVFDRLAEAPDYRGHLYDSGSLSVVTGPVEGSRTQISSRVQLHGNNLLKVILGVAQPYTDRRDYPEPDELLSGTILRSLAITPRRHSGRYHRLQR